MIWQKWWFGNFQHQKWNLLQNVQFLAEVDALVIIVSASVESHGQTGNGKCKGFYYEKYEK